MENDNLILIAKFCLHHNVDQSFVLSLQEFGLIKVFEFKKELYLAPDEMAKLERMVRLHYDLGVNFEGIDAINGLLQRIVLLQEELNVARNSLDAFAPYRDSFGENLTH